jgi:hypothetical protein
MNPPLAIRFPILAAAALAGALQAQNNAIGFTAGWDTSYTDRIGATTIVADALNHFDDRNVSDWMLDPADPTGANYTFTAFRWVGQDQLDTTAETYTVVGYNEDPAQANFPNAAAPWFRTGTVNFPASTTGGPAAWIMTLTFAPPSVPKGDKWIGVGMPQPTTGTWPTDGVSAHTIWDFPPGNTGTNALDQVGPGIATLSTNNLSCHLPTPAGVPTGPAIYPGGAAGTRRQMRIEIFANVAGGVCVTQTNQPRLPSSAPGTANALVPLGGTTNWLSGAHPDVNDFNLQTTPGPRQDDIGFLVTDASVPNGPVFVLFAFGPSPIGSLPLTSLVTGASPGTKGNVCIDFTSSANFFGISNATGVHQFMLNLTPAARGIIQSIAPVDFWYQGFVLNLSSGLEIHATGCGVQHL